MRLIHLIYRKTHFRGSKWGGGRAAYALERRIHRYLLYCCPTSKIRHYYTLGVDMFQFDCSHNEDVFNSHCTFSLRYKLHVKELEVEKTVKIEQIDS